MFLNNRFYIASHGAASNFLIWTSSLFFFIRLFYLSTRFISVLTLKSSTIYWLTCFRVSSGLFPVLFWMLWMLITVHKLCHVPDALQITNWETIFMERHFCVSKEWVGSWSYAFLITYHKRWLKSFSAVRPGKLTRRKKKTRMAIVKLFALNANAKIHFIDAFQAFYTRARSRHSKAFIY